MRWSATRHDTQSFMVYYGFLGVKVSNESSRIIFDVGYDMVVAFICYGISIVVRVTVKSLIRDELRELRLQSNATACRLELIDRRVTAILRDALEQRQAASMRGAIRTTHRQAYDQQRRSA